MRYLSLVLGAVCALALWSGPTAHCADIAPGEFLNPANWEGLMEYWALKDGSITGSTPNGLKFNTFLCSKKKYKDFELKFQVKMIGKGWTGNSGVQVRSKIRDSAQPSVDVVFEIPRAAVAGDLRIILASVEMIARIKHTHFESGRLVLRAERTGTTQDRSQNQYKRLHVCSVSFS